MHQKFYKFILILERTLFIYFFSVLVGAPLDQNRQPNTTHSGALWRCPMTQRFDDCEQVITDGRRSK